MNGTPHSAALYAVAAAGSAELLIYTTLTYNKTISCFLSFL
jgi:hypothetical protein